MLHLALLAIIDLWAIDPDATAPPTPQLAQRLTGANDTTAALAATNDRLGPSPISPCTYGAPPLDSHFWSDANNLMRTFTTPECSDSTSALQYGFGAESLLNFYPIGMAPPGAALSPGVYLPERSMPSPRRSGVTAATGFAGPNGVVLRVPQGDRSRSGVLLRSGEVERAPVRIPTH